MDKFVEDPASQTHLRIALARRVCENLEKGRKYPQLDKFCIPDCNVVFVIGYRADEIHVFVPWLSTHELNMYDVTRMQEYIANLYKGSIFHVALCDRDSSVIYYSLTRGFLDRPEFWHKKIDQL